MLRRRAGNPATCDVSLVPHRLLFLNFTNLLCRQMTALRDGQSLPPSDNLIRFLVESTSEEYPSCANCDRNEKSPMFFCNTCGKYTTVMALPSPNVRLNVFVMQLPVKVHFTTIETGFEQLLPSSLLD